MKTLYTQSELNKIKRNIRLHHYAEAFAIYAAILGSSLIVLKVLEVL